MKTVNVHAAKTHLSRLLEEVSGGGEVVIARAGRPVARLVAVEPAPAGGRGFGALKGRVRIRGNFDAPLPSDLARALGVRR
jgi:prevent-host-death family protein